MATTLSLIPNFVWQMLDNSGKPAAGAKIYTWESGTTTPKATYQDYEGAIEWSDPVVLNAYGRATIFGSGVYSIRVLAADDSVLIDKIDGVVFSLVGDTSSTISVLPNYAAVRALTTVPDQIYVQGRLTAGDGGQGLFASVASGSDNDGTLLVANSGAAYYSRIYDSVLDPQWFGVAYAKSTSQYTAIVSALAASAATGNPLYASSSMTSAQDISVPSGACLSFGEGGSITGSVSIALKCLPGSRFVGSRGCIGANVTLTANVGCCDYINPNWFVGSDNYKLSAAANAVSASSLTLGTMTGAGWGEDTASNAWHHAPGDSTYGVLAVNNMANARRYVVDFDVARREQVEYVCSNNVVSLGWDGSWLTGYTHRSSGGGNTNVLSITTTAKLDATHVYAFSATISGMSKGSLRITLGTTNIGTYSVNGAVTSNITFTADNPTLGFAPSADFDGTLTNITLTKPASLLADAIQQMTLVSAGWTGSKTALTHTAGNTTPATFTLSNPLPAGTRINGAFNLVRSTVQPELIGGAVWSTVGWAGSLTAAAYCNRFTLTVSGNLYTPVYLANGQPAPTDQEVYNYFHYYNHAAEDIYNDNSGTLFGLDNANTYTVTFTVANMTEGSVELGAQGSMAMYYANGTYTVNVKPTSGSVSIRAVGGCLRGNAANGYIGAQRAFNGTVQASIKVANPGNVVVSADGATVVLNNDPTKLAKDVGAYLFNVTTTGTTSNTLVLTPTTDFDGTIDSLTYTIEYPGVCAVYAGGYTTGHTITRDGHYSIVFTGSAVSNNVTFRPSASFYGDITGITVAEDSAVMPIKTTDIYTVSADVSLPYFDPWGGLIIFTAAASLSLAGIIDNRALAYISGAEYLTAVNLGSAIAYPEHAGAVGSGTSDDYAGIKYALLSGQAYLSGIYEIGTSITVINDVILSGPNSDDATIDSSGRLVIDKGVTVSTGYQTLDGVVLDISGTLSCSGLDIKHGYVRTDTTGIWASSGPVAGKSSTLNLWSGLANTGVATLRSVDIASSNTVTYIAPIHNLSTARNCTFTGCGGIPTAAVANVNDCDFDSPKSVGLIVPAGGTLTVNRCSKACALFVSSGAGSTTYIYNTPSYDRVQSIASMLSYVEDTSLLHDGVGTVITDESPVRSTNPMLPRTRMSSSTYGTYPFSVIPDLVMTAGSWLYGPRMAIAVNYTDDPFLPDPVGNEFWTVSGNGCTVTTPNDDQVRSVWFKWETGTTGFTGFDISRLMWANVVTMTVAPPVGGFAKGASIRLQDGYRWYQTDPSTDASVYTGYSQEVFVVRDRTIDLPIGGGSAVNVTLPAVTGIATGLPSVYYHYNSDYQGTDAKTVLTSRLAYSTPFGLSMINLNGATVTVTMSLRLPDDNSVNMFAHTITDRKVFSLLSVNSSAQLNNHVSTWDIINSRLIRTNQLGLETAMINNGALGSVVKSNWNICHYNWNMDDNSDAGFAWINMTDGATIKHEVRHN